MTHRGMSQHMESTHRRRVLVGPDAKVIDLVSRLPLGLYQRPVIAAARLGSRLSRRRA